MSAWIQTHISRPYAAALDISIASDKAGINLDYANMLFHKNDVSVVPCPSKSGGWKRGLNASNELSELMVWRELHNFFPMPNS